MRCLVIGGNFTNRGAESMVKVTVDQLASLWPGVQTFVASYAKTERRPFGPCVVVGSQGPVEFEFIRNSRSPLRLLRAGLALIAPSGLRRRIVKGDPYLATFEAADLVVDISGFALSDQRGVIRRLFVALECLTAVSLRKPLFLLTQAFGPMRKRLTRAIARWVLPRAELVVARDEESVNHILGLGIKAEVALHRCADMAMLLPDIQVSSRGAKGRPLLGIVPNVNLLTREERNGTPGEYVQQLAEVADLGSELGADVIFICYESFPDREIDDVWVARQAILRASLPGIRLVEDEEANALKGLIGSVDYLVGARFHGVVASVATATPFLAVGWAHKYAELATEAGVPEAFVDGRTATTEQLLSAVREGWSSRAGTRRALEARRPALVVSAQRAFEILYETVSGGPESVD